MNRTLELLFRCAMRCLFAVALLATTLVTEVRAEVLDVWLGTGRSSLSKGIYHCRFNTEDGKLTEPTLAAEMEGPGFLAKHPTLAVLYAVGGLKNEQVVAAFGIDDTSSTPSLKFLNAVPIGDGGAAHVSVDKTGKTLFTAQYGGGSIAAFSLNADGSLKERTQLIDHEGGTKVVAGRQDASHAHWTGVSPDNQFVFVPDLGLDQVVIYKLDAATGKITSHGKGSVPPGSGPRHMKFHPNGKWIYVLNELALTVTHFDYDPAAGKMSARQNIETVDPDLLFREKAKSTSEICIHPNGKFVYAANRGHDTISVFRVNPATGELTLVQVENVRGATPRNFNLSPDGKWLLAAGQLSNTLGVFSIDQSNGLITFHQTSVFAPTPICVLFE
ncbi:MAG: lactonase family protein [Pirellulaceae bacterium]|nr:lactonase family protein [Pirellulaceae bacterium]